MPDFPNCNQKVIMLTGKCLLYKRAPFLYNPGKTDYGEPSIGRLIRQVLKTVDDSQKNR
jgi:hypothetical protein